MFPVSVGTKSLLSRPLLLDICPLAHYSIYPPFPAQHSPFTFKMAKLRATHTVRNPELILRLFRTPLSLTLFLTYHPLLTLEDKSS